MAANCIACGCHITYEVYRPGEHPLSVLALPKTRQEARNAVRFPMNFRACGDCGHIFNADFDYYQIPYEEDSNLMYNQAVIWRQYMEDLVDELVSRYHAAGKTLVDIGCGDGGFLHILLQRELGCRCVGFEPGVESANARRNGLEVYKDYFIPMRDLVRMRPDFLVCRHVIEHLANPREFVSEIAYWCNVHRVFPVFLAEVPRIDNAIAQRRINDYLYEHPSNFTEFSFRNMFEISGFEVLDCRPAYHDEVVVAFVRARRTERLQQIRQDAFDYARSLKEQRQAVPEQLAALKAAGKSVAFWGATGKGASFLNAFDLMAEDWPVVVDSDEKKVGRFVPRTA